MNRYEENLKLYHAMDNIKNDVQSKKNIMLYKRYRAVYLFLDDEEVENIAAELELTPPTIIKYVDAYFKDGLEGLQIKKAIGQPKKLSTQQENELKNIILNNTPKTLNLDDKEYWTSSLVKELIKTKYRRKFSIKGVIKLLNRIGIYYHRGNYSIDK